MSNLAWKWFVFYQEPGDDGRFIEMVSNATFYSEADAKMFITEAMVEGAVDIPSGSKILNMGATSFWRQPGLLLGRFSRRVVPPNRPNGGNKGKKKKGQ